MRVLLVYPYFLYDRVHAENIEAVPMGLHYLGAALAEAGHEVELANWHDVGGRPQVVEAALRRFRPQVIGVSIFHANRWGGLDVAEFAREVLPDVRIVFGGIGATFLQDLLLARFDCVDFVVRGEGEVTFPELLRTLEQGGDPAEVRGLALRRDGRVLATPDREPIRDLDSLPMPARRYTFQHLALTRGCPGKCSFCGSPRFWGPKVRSHSPGYFVDQMELLRARGVSFFYVSDDTFTLRKDAVLEVCSLIRERGLDAAWAAISRVDRVDAEMLGAMRSAGCIQLSFGVESGSGEMRRVLGKRTSEASMERAFRLTAGAGMLPRAYFIYGSPGESDETIGQSIDLMPRLRPLVSLFHVLAVFPGTELYERFKRATGATDEMWLERGEDALWFEADPDMDAERVMAWGRRLREAFYQGLPGFALALEPPDDPAKAGLFGDFLGRLGLTFEQGDYADPETVPDHDRVAEALYRKALACSPHDERARQGLDRLLKNPRPPRSR